MRLVFVIRPTVLISLAICLGFLAARAKPQSLDTPHPPTALATPETVSAVVARHERALIEALKGYIQLHDGAGDLEQAYLNVFETAIKNDWFVDNEDLAARYLRFFDAGAVRPLAQIVIVMARAQSGRYQEALVAFDDLLSGLDRLDQREFVASFSEQFVGQATAAGQFEVARRICKLVLEKFGDDPLLRENARAELARLDLVGQRAPEFTLHDTRGRSIRLADLRGKWVLIDFWASYCVPCLSDLPTLQAAQSAYESKGLEVISISLDDTAELASETARARAMRWAQVHNATCGEDVVAAYHVRKIPSSVLIDREGRVRRLDLRGAELSKALAEQFPASKSNP